MSDFNYGNKRADGQYERHPGQVDPAKPYVRPLRYSYKHIGCRPAGPTRPLTPDEIEQNRGMDYVCFEPYGPEHAPVVGRFWTQKQLESGCGTVTRMPAHCAETYAQNPSFYGRTFCCGCRNYFPVGIGGEFVWMNEDGTETNERVGA